MCVSCTEKRAMAAKYLGTIQDNKKLYQSIGERLERLEREMMPAGYPNKSVFEGGSGGVFIPTINQLEMVTEYKKKLQDIHKEIVSSEIEVVDCIDAMDDIQEKSILIDKYINGKTLAAISEEWRLNEMKGCSIENVKLLHRQGLVNFYEKNQKKLNF